MFDNDLDADIPPASKLTFSVEGIGVVADDPAKMIIMREPVIFPHGLTSISLQHPEDIATLDQVMAGDRMLAVFNLLPDEDEMGSIPFDRKFFQPFDYYGMPVCGCGVMVRVVKELRMPDNSRRLVVRGLRRIIGVLPGMSAEGTPQISYRNMLEPSGSVMSKAAMGYQKNIIMTFQELSSLQPGFPEELTSAVNSGKVPSRTCDMIADAMNFSYAEKLVLLAFPDIINRLEFLSVLLNRELETLQLGMKIHAEVQETMSESQREFYLREQLRTIKQELGEISSNSDVVALTEKLETVSLPDNVAETIHRELERLELIPQNAPEYHINYNYISWLLNIPWHVFSEDQLDCLRAAKVLDDDHYGLEDVKDRILEFLAVMQLRANDSECRAPILCLVGPPGVGKTSIGRSIARAMNREFIRVSLGGVRDEAEIRGHRRTYVGAMPGRIVQNLKRVGTSNPVFMLDEVDKLAHDFRGDPASALLEVLDPEQNNTFNDNFVELPLDLSKVFFIATANVLEEIPGPLQDRMEVIQLPGYTAVEKREIAKRYLVKRQIKENGLDPKMVKFRVSAIDEIIDGYTREAGVRTLDRTIARLCRRIARKLLSGEIDSAAPLAVDKALVGKLLGARKFLPEKAEQTPPAGCATGMAWTSVGGVILPVETIAVPGGKGEIKLTGSLGKVMQESAAAAFTVVRSRGEKFNLKPEYFTTNDFHIHVPDGATPKDGPSAGITIALALTSLLSGKPLIKRLAMTGEITLQGRITAIGGVREKLMGAITAGIDKILLPEENRKDYLELPDYIKNKVSVNFVSTLAEAEKYAFGQEPFHTTEVKK